MSVQTVLKSVVRGIERESPAILIGLGITGFVTTVALAIEATPKALYLLDKESRIRNHYVVEEGKEPIPFTRLESVKIVWKCYIPTVVVGLSSIGCFVLANSIQLNRNAAIAGLYSLSEATMKEYQKKVVEIIGKNKEEKVHDAILQDRIEANPLSKTEVIVTGNGETLFYDSWSGRYFKGDMEKVRRVQNDLNAAMLGGDMYTPLNDLYSELGLENVVGGERIGWCLETNGLLDIKFTAKIAEGQPCIVMEYRLAPKEF